MEPNASLIQTLPQDQSARDKAETIKHGKYHAIKTKCVILIAIIGFVGYLLYGIDKINSSQNHPETKSDQKPVSQYHVPLTLVCSYFPLDNGFSYLDYFYYYSVINSTHGSQTNVCGNQFNYSNDGCKCEFNLNSSWLDPCTPYITDDYTQPLRRDVWTILRYNKTAGENVAENCWAMIPPQNATFNLDLYFEFVHVPNNADLIFFNNSIESTVAIMMSDNEISTPQIEYTAIHPDGIEHWYSQLQTPLSPYLTIIDTIAGFPWHALSLWKSSEISLSLYTTKSISNQEKHVYDNRLISDQYQKGYLEVELQSSGDGYACDGCPPLFLPKYSFKIDANIEALNDDGSPQLFQTYTTQYAGYTWVDLVSGMGGFIGSILTTVGIIFGIILNGDFVRSLLKWDGLAPYPPFDQHFQVRLKRFFS